MPDPYRGTGDSVSAPAARCAVIAPNDLTDLPFSTKGIYVGTTGDISLILVGDANAVLFKSVPVGILPVRARRVMNSGTSASNLVALL